MTRIQTLALILGTLSITACLDADATEPDDTANAEQAISDDNTPEPAPSPGEVIEQGGVLTVFPGVRSCYPELYAPQSAGIGGNYSYRNFVKYPRLSVFWRPNLNTAVGRIYAGSVVPNASGFYQKTFNRMTDPGRFPGYFTFCLRNSAQNPGPFQTSSTVVTF